MTKFAIYLEIKSTKVNLPFIILQIKLYEPIDEFHRFRG